MVCGIEKFWNIPNCFYLVDPLIIKKINWISFRTFRGSLFHKVQWDSKKCGDSLSLAENSNQFFTVLGRRTSSFLIRILIWHIFLSSIELSDKKLPLGPQKSESPGQKLRSKLQKTLYCASLFSQSVFFLVGSSRQSSSWNKNDSEGASWFVFAYALSQDIHYFVLCNYILPQFYLQ